MTVTNWSAIKLAAVAALGTVALASGQAGIAQQKTAVSKEEAEGIIFERQQIMEQLEGKAETLGNIVAGLDKKSSLVDTTKEVAALVKEARTSFEAHVPGGRSKPEIWTTGAADYKARMDAWVKATEEMAKVAEGGNPQAVVTIMGPGMPCKQCHEVYRAPAKPKA